MSFTDLFIRRPILSIVLSLLILLVGFRALLDLPTRQFPLLTSTVITIRTAYPGAPSDLIQGFITTPIERAVSAIDGIDYVTSRSVQSVSMVTVNMKLNKDPGEAMTDVLTKVQQVKSQLPVDANDPIITKSGDSQSVMVMAFRSAEVARASIFDYVNRVVQPILSTVPGIASTDPLGGGSFAMRIWLDPVRMAARSLTAEDVTNALRANNVQAAPGRTKGEFTTRSITTNTGLTDVEQFREMVLKSTDGVATRLKDIADVELEAQSNDFDNRVDGAAAAVIGVNPAPAGNPLEISKGIRALLPQLERTLPPGGSLMIATDNSIYIQKSMDEVIKTLTEAVIVVLIVIYLFLGSARALLIPLVAIPLSIIGVAFLAVPLGFSLNLLTMLAMVLAIGLVVDDAIVVVENISRHIEEGLSPMDAALLGAREIVGPIIAMTITLAAVYAPIGFLSGLTGVLFREFAFTLSGAVIISGLVALTLSPMMCSVFLRPASESGRVARVFGAVFDKFRVAYSRWLSVSLDYRPVVGIFAIGVAVSIVFMFSNTRSELAPTEDQGFLSINLRGPEFANVDYMKTYGLKIDALVGAIPEVEHWGVNMGGESQNTGFVPIPLKSWDERTRSQAEIGQYLQREINKFDGVTGFVTQQPPLPAATRGGGPPIQLVVGSQGSYEELYDTVERIKAAGRASGLFLAIDSTLNFNSPRVHIQIDHAKANDLGITMGSISRTLATLVGENYVNYFNLEGRSYQVIPQVPRTMRDTGEALTQFYVRSAGGEMIPLSTIATVTSAVQPNALTRHNQLNSATFQATPVRGVTMGQAVAFLREQAAALPQGFTTDFLGESRQYVEEGNQLFITFGFALLIIFLVLSAQFNSMRDSLVIMVSVPMSIFGALIPLFFGLTTMNIYTQIGLVTLIGLISKHGILMVAFARELQIKEGLDRRAAIEQSAAIRLRPIIMTTGAMVGGLLPLVFASGAGSASRFSLGVVVVSGMAIGTLFTLFVLPTVYVWLGTDHRVAATSPLQRHAADPLPSGAAE